MPKAREKGVEHERGLFPLSLGGYENFFEFQALLCVFLMGVFMRLGPDFSRFGYDLLQEKKPNTGQNCFQTVTIFFFTFFHQHVSLTLFHLCPRRFWQSTFSTDR